VALSNTESLANGACSELASFTGAGTDDAPQLLLSLPVLVNPGVPDYTGLVIDRNAVVSPADSSGTQFVTTCITERRQSTRRICFTAGFRRSPTSRLAHWFPPLNSRFAPTLFERRRVADTEPEAISIVVCVGFLTGGLRLAAILVSGLQVLVRGTAVSLGEIAGQ